MSAPLQLATPADGGEILRILESSAAKGLIELIYTRRPDAYASYEAEPGESRVFVSKDGERTVGTCAEIIRPVYLGGETATAAYVCGLKKDAGYEGDVGFYLSFIRSLQREDIDFYYCSVVGDNREAMAMFRKGKRAITVTPMATYRTYILNPRLRIPSPRKDLTLRPATEADLPALLAFLNTEGRRRDLFPVVRSLSDFHGLRPSDFYLLEGREGLVATAALWDQIDYRQYAVKRYRGPMKAARLLGPLLSALGYIRLPREDEPLRFPMLSFLLAKEEDEGLYRALLSALFPIVARRYGVLVLGLPADKEAPHPLGRVLDHLPSIHFDSTLCAIAFPWSPRPLRAPNPHHLHPECGML